jgi:hypothetical protein
MLSLSVLHKTFPYSLSVKQLYSISQIFICQIVLSANNNYTLTIYFAGGCATTAIKQIETAEIYHILPFPTYLRELVKTWFSEKKAT